ncbi:RNA polymerase sigma factor [Eubacterium uniforme]|uniref:RNA polymerase sigma-70 factor, ECF subfamily n=1 Tax=Eubacterium uniforme TaxID=39495 RepID=A0A1T4VVE6_9FIRM|nr:RNA polymerase sigma factor [Eubacterium uniforme]SKA68980.1 RNA polymerase sigma-70 factor, ECF subfamily [Eubacterium uniforme]HAH18019.1 RNA polymerase sigma factor [Eubacterium sp.]HAV91017.1 RNA polymerase sigma factor [Eubacterium sp.]
MDKRERQLDVEETINKYSDLLYKTSFLMLKNQQDSEDIVQETFIAYIKNNPELNDEEHKKAWLLKVAQNKCKNLLKSHKIRAYVPFDDVEEVIPGEEKELYEEDSSELLAISNLSYKYKSVITLYYIENYSIEETAKILDISVSAVKMRLKRGREKLKIEFKDREDLLKGGAY